AGGVDGAQERLDAQGRPRDQAPDPVLLPTAARCRWGVPPGVASGLMPGFSGLPVNLLVRGRRVVVVGAGRIAARKIEPLLDLGAEVVVVAPEAVPEIRAWVAAGRCHLVEREFRPADLDGAWLAFSATDAPGVNAAV